MKENIMELTFDYKNKTYTVQEFVDEFKVPYNTVYGRVLNNQDLSELTEPTWVTQRAPLRITRYKDGSPYMLEYNNKKVTLGELSTLIGPSPSTLSKWITQKNWSAFKIMERAEDKYEKKVTITPHHAKQYNKLTKKEMAQIAKEVADASNTKEAQEIFAKNVTEKTTVKEEDKIVKPKGFFNKLKFLFSN